MLKKMIKKDLHFKELLKGSSIAFILKIIGMIISFMLMHYITNNFGPSKYGALTLIITLLSIFMLIIRFGTNTALVRIVAHLEISSNIGHINDIFWKSIFITMPIAVLSYFLLTYNADFLANMFLHEMDYKNEIKMASLTFFPLLLLGLIASTLQGMKKILIYSGLSIVMPQLSFLVLLMVNKFFFESTYSLVNIYIMSVYSSFIVALIFYFIHFKPYKIIESKYTIKKILSLSYPMLIASSFGMLMIWTDILMLGYFQGEESVGKYNVAFRVATVVSIVLVSINAIATPKFAELYTQKNFEGLERFVKQSTKLIFWLTLPVILIIVFAATPILSLFGSEFMTTKTALLMLIFGQFISAISGSVGYLLQMTDNQSIHKNILISATIINMILNLILIPLYGLNGAAFASMLSMIFWNLAMILAIKNKLNFWTMYVPFISQRSVNVN
jgi:O-antigen/teichoic acid export membrane protein